MAAIARPINNESFPPVLLQWNKSWGSCRGVYFSSDNAKTSIGHSAPKLLLGGLHGPCSCLLPSPPKGAFSGLACNTVCLRLRYSLATVAATVSYASVERSAPGRLRRLAVHVAVALRSNFSLTTFPPGPVWEFKNNSRVRGSILRPRKEFSVVSSTVH
eukprot:1148892-Pelagomonas_calceolata.AAC.2